MTPWERVQRIVESGGTFVIAGPDPLCKQTPRFGATLESASGARVGDGYAPTLDECLAEVVRDFDLPKPARVA